MSDADREKWERRYAEGSYEARTHPSRLLVDWLPKISKPDAARALDLSFVPLTVERYDLVIPDASFQKEEIQALIDVIRSEAFQRSVQDLGGYDVSKMGQAMGPD